MKPARDAVHGQFGIAPIFISAGELSGDILAAELVNSLQARAPGSRFFGICGPKMLDVGVEPLLDQEDLAVMGLWDVLNKIGKIQRIIRMVAAEMEQRGSQQAILVDYPGFHFALAEQLKIRGIRVIQYVAPKLWAWGSNRKFKLRRDFSMVLGILPFEEKFFKDAKVPYCYIGNPHRDRIDRFLKTVGPKKNEYIALLPGSRPSEVRRIMPIFTKLMLTLENRHRSFEYVIAVADSLDSEFIESFLKDLPQSLRAHIKLKAGNSLEIMHHAKVALLCSGTATLECGLLKTPMIVVYRMDCLSYWVAKALVKIKWISLVNLILNENLVSEYIQHIDFDRLASELCELQNPGLRREKMLKGLYWLSALLKGDASDRAAESIIATP